MMGGNRQGQLAGRHNHKKTLIDVKTIDKNIEFMEDSQFYKDELNQMTHMMDFFFLLDTQYLIDFIIQRDKMK
jgi:hypothetical protein